MNRIEAMDAVAAARSDAVVITGPGANSGLLYERADAPATIYNMEMGYAAAVALGIALARPRRREDAQLLVYIILPESPGKKPRAVVRCRGRP